MDYDFVVDTTAIDNLIDQLDEGIAILNQLIVNLYDSFTSLPSREIWGGAVYDAFMTGAGLSAKTLKDDYIDPAFKTLTDFSSILNAVSAKADSLVKGEYRGSSYGGCGGGGGIISTAGNLSRRTDMVR